MAIMVGTGRGARAGILIRNAEALEIFGEGRHPRRRQDGNSYRRQAATQYRRSQPRASTKTQLLQAIASLEKASEHPLAAAIIAGAKEKKLRVAAGEQTSCRSQVKVSPAPCRASRLPLGNAALMSDLGALASIGAAAEKPSQGRADGHARVRRPIGRPCCGRRPHQRIDARGDPGTESEGIKVVMMTGDNLTTAAVWHRSSALSSRPMFCRRRKPRSSRSCSRKGRSSPWRAMASTTHPRWHRRR